MIYKIIIGKKEIQIDEDEKRFFTQNQNNRFIELKSGEIINTAFVQGIVVDEELSKIENIEKLKLLEKDALSEKELENLKLVYSQKDKLEIKEFSNLLEKNNKSIILK